jgi:polar amino acid transport system substrate-binding protein
MRLFLFWLLCLLTLVTHAQGITPPEPFELVTSDLAPYAIANQPTSPGALVELVETMMQRMGRAQQVRFVPWARAVAMAQTGERIAILPLSRTPEREAKFRWLVKLYPVRFVFITRDDAKRPAQTLEQARQLSVGVLRGAPNLTQLLNHGFDRKLISEETTIESIFKSLDHGLIEAYYGPEAVGLTTLRATGRDPARYRIGLLLEQNEIWLAGSAKFNDNDIKILQKTLDALKKDGTYSRLLKKYHLPE